MTFACLDDYSATAAQMQTTVDPYPAGAVSLATTGQGEIERLRYISLHVFGATQWYTAPTENINFRHRRVEMHMGAITALQEMYVGAQTWSNAAVRFHGMAASRRAMPQKPVAPATNRPAPTKAARPQKARWTSRPNAAPSRISPPAAIWT